MYSVVCDRCGRTLGDGVVWEDKSTAISYALNSKWKEIGDKHYCQDCYEFTVKGVKIMVASIKDIYYIEEEY